MNDFIKFVIQHWELWLAFFLILAYWIALEVEEHYRGRGLSPQQVIHSINRNNGVVIDLRSTESFKAGHILGALSFPEKEVFDQLNKLKKYQQKPVILVDVNGVTANKLMNKFGVHGFADVYYLKNGINAWQRANMPLHKE